MIKNRMRFFFNKNVQIFQKVTNHKKINYKPVQSPIGVSHSSLRICQYQTWLFMKI